MASRGATETCPLGLKIVFEGSVRVVGSFKGFRNLLKGLCPLPGNSKGFCSRWKNWRGHFFLFFFCLPPGFLPVVGPWCCLRHLPRPCYVALGQALICGWTQNLITFVHTHETRVLPMPCMHITKLYSPFNEIEKVF